MKRMLLSLYTGCCLFRIVCPICRQSERFTESKQIRRSQGRNRQGSVTEKYQKNAEAWYTKVKIYDTIGMNPQLKDQYPDALVQALDALKKYVQYDDKKQLLLLTTDGYRPINVIYSGLFQAGAADYNAQKYSDAL